MAPGYEIALWLEGLGLCGLAIGLWRMRLEEAARGRALRTALRTGPDPRVLPGRPRPDRTRMVPHVAGLRGARSGARAGTAPSAAAHALARAFTREA